MAGARPTNGELRAEVERLRARVAELEAERGVVVTPADRLTTVRVPEDIAPVFLRAQDYVSRYFAHLERDPEHSSISISGERYVLVRAASLSVEFFELVASLYQDRDPAEGRSVARQLLFDVAHALGKADAKAIVAATGVSDPIEKLSAGPVHFAFSGWAFVDIKPESTPRPDERFCLVYEHPFSFESDAWLKQGRAADRPVCIMNAGYSSGWCAESFGLDLVAVEVECRASGAARCRFVMAPPTQIAARLAEHDPARRGPREAPAEAGTPGFLERERARDELRAALLEQARQRVAVEQALAASEATRREIFEAANDGMAVIALDASAVLDVNQRLCEIFHCEREDVLRGRFGPLGEALLGAADALRARLRAASDGVPQLFEWSVPDGRGGIRHVEIALKRGRIAAAERLLAIVRDVTERKQAELAIERARDLALESGRLKSEFLANMSHEIRTPLHVIFGMNDLLREEPDLTDEQRELTEAVHRNAAGLIQIVDDILDLSRIEAGKLELHRAPCSVRAVVRDAVEVYAPRARAKGLALRVEVPDDLPVELVADAGRIRQILLNLIGNAVKFTPAGWISVRVEVVHAGAGGLTLRFAVEDSGIGIPSDQRHRLFRSFSQVDGSMTRQFGGIGLGLAISRQLVDLMGGDIGVESEPGKGSRFWFTLSLERVPAVVPAVPRRLHAS